MPFRVRSGLCALIAAIALTSCARHSADLPKSKSQPKPGTAEVPDTTAPPAHTQGHIESPNIPVGTNEPVRLPTGPEALAKGARLYETHCVSCHGPEGEGGKGPTLALPSLPRASDDESLLRIIRSGIEGTEMPRSRMERQEVALVTAYVKSLGSRPREAVPGDALRGAQLFKTKGTCFQCHVVNGYGGAYGPDLSDIGRRRSAAYLRRSLIDPNAEVPQSFSAFRNTVSLPENFLYVRVITPDGAEIPGVRVNEDTFSIQIREIAGRIHSFYKSEIQLIKEFGKSPMPSYAQTLAPDELDDLVAYLVSLRGLK